MKAKNKTHRSNDPEYLKQLAEEFGLIGRDYDLNLREGTITQFVLPRQKPKKKDDKNEKRGRRDKER